MALRLSGAHDLQPFVRALGGHRQGGGVNLPPISTPPTAQTLRDRVLVQLAHANGNLTEPDKRRRTMLLARLRQERDR